MKEKTHAITADGSQSNRLNRQVKYIYSDLTAAMASTTRHRDSSTSLKVLTLNCWGLKLPKPFCQLRKERIQAISEKLAEGEFQLVLLQEVWVQSDFDEICVKVIKVLPYSHYFHSGVFGSGLCVFSKFPILETLQHRFPVNGSPFQIFQGDWYAEKSVGLVQLWVNELRVHVYVTHTHADYEKKEAYRTHRIVQAFELSQFVRNTSAGCDAVIVGGDLNSRPSDIGYNMVLANGNLLDSWVQQISPNKESLGATNDTPGNSFTKSSLLETNPQGKRVDYVLYGYNAGCHVICDECRTVMEKVPDKDYCYSDHSGVAASLRIRKNPTAMAPERLTSAVVEMYAAAVLQLEDGVSSCQNKRIFYGLTAFLSLITLLFLGNLDLGGYFYYPVGYLRLALCLVIGLCVWCALVVTYREENALRSAKKDMEIQIKSANT